MAQWAVNSKQPMKTKFTVNFLLSFFRFATQQRDGLLFYNGRFNERHDFIALEIVDGQVQFSFSLGADITKVSPSFPGGVNDGNWHQVTVSYLNRVSRLCC